MLLEPTSMGWSGVAISFITIDLSVSWAISDWIATTSSSVTSYSLTPLWRCTASSLEKKLLICCELLHSWGENTRWPPSFLTTFISLANWKGSALCPPFAPSLNFPSKKFLCLFCHSWGFLDDSQGPTWLSNVTYFSEATGLFNWYSTSACALEVKCNSRYSACPLLPYLVEHWLWLYLSSVFACIHVLVYLWLSSKSQNAPCLPTCKNVSLISNTFSQCIKFLDRWSKRLDYFQTSVSLWCSLKFDIGYQATWTNVVGLPHSYASVLKLEVI